MPRNKCVLPFYMGLFYIRKAIVSSLGLGWRSVNISVKERKQSAVKYNNAWRIYNCVFADVAREAHKDK